MKKKMIFAFLIGLIMLLTACNEKHQIYRTIFIASAGFERQGDKLTGYFLLSNTIDVGNGKDNSEIKPEFATIEGKTISEIVDNLRVFSLYVNMRHMSSIILHESVLNNKDVKHITDFIIDVYEFDYNNYIFTTKDSIKEIYSYKNPNNESGILSTILDPVSNDNVYPCANPPHLLNFLKDYNLSKTILLPLLEKQEVWTKDDKKIITINHRGVTIINKSTNLCLPFTDYTFSYIKNNEEIIFSNEKYSVLLSDYQIKWDYSDKLYGRIKAFYHLTLDDGSTSEEVIKEMIISHLNKAMEYQRKYDIFNSRLFAKKWLMNANYKIELIRV